jgi:hypothetical protein
MDASPGLVLPRRHRHPLPRPPGAPAWHRPIRCLCKHMLLFAILAQPRWVRRHICLPTCLPVGREGGCAHGPAQRIASHPNMSCFTHVDIATTDGRIGRQADRKADSLVLSRLLSCLSHPTPPRFHSTYSTLPHSTPLHANYSQTRTHRKTRQDKTRHPTKQRGASWRAP